MATASDLIDLYLTDRRKRGELCAKRAVADRSVLYGLAEHLGKRQLRNVSVRHVESWLGSIGHLAPATRRTRLSSVRSFFGWAARRGHCRSNPAAEVQAPRQPRYVPRALAAGQISAVLDHCPDARARLIVTLTVQQGLRCIEISRLELGDVDHINHTMRVTGKGGHERLLPVTEETMVALGDYLAEHPWSAGPLIRSYTECQRSLSAGTISRLVAEWMRDAGVKRKPHDGVGAHAGRHTCATDMLRAGAHVRDVQAALGHRNLRTTEIYLPYVVKGLHDAMSGRQYRRDGPGWQPAT